MLYVFLYVWMGIFPLVLHGASLGTALDLRRTYQDDLRYDDVTFLTTHNAFTIAKEGWRVFQQSLNFDEQFNYGVWSFMLDLHWCKEKGSLSVVLAHEPWASSNEYNYSNPFEQHHLAGCARSRNQRSRPGHLPFESFLKSHVLKWLKEDNQAILTLHLESYIGTNGAFELREIFRRAGVLDYIYQHSSQKSWPTLGEMRKNGKRLVLFSSNPGDCGLNDVFSTMYYRETKYNLRNSPNCERRFDERDYSNATSLLLMNHFYPGSFATSTLTYHQINNPYSSSMLDKYKSLESPELRRRTEQCFQQEKMLPNYVAVDFVEEGDVGGAREWVLYLNHLRQMKRDNPTLLLDSFLNDVVSQPSLGSSSELIEMPEPLTIEAAILEAFLKLGDPGLQVTLSSVLALAACKYPWMAYPDALFGTLGVMPWLENWAGYCTPARFSLALNSLETMACSMFLYYYHPLHAFVWLEKNLVRPLVAARISGKKRR